MRSLLGGALAIQVVLATSAAQAQPAPSEFLAASITINTTPEAFSASALERRPGATLPPGVDPNGPPLATALQDQLGLRLDATRAPLEVIVVDRMEPVTGD